MTNVKTTKRALFASVMSMLICVSMLIGSTFAWFTDTASTGLNKIIAGNLDVELYMHDGSDYVNIGDSDQPIFNSEGATAATSNNLNTLWEPGKTQVAYLMIKNAGNLALKYQVALNTINPEDSKDLYKVMQYQIVPGAKDNASWSTGTNVTPGTAIVSADNVPMLPNDEHYFALLIHMDKDAGNEYMNGKVNFDITILATQLNSEADSFGSDYDEDSEYFIEATTAADAAAILTNGGTLNITEPLTLDGGLAVNADATLTNGTISNPTTSYAFSANEGTFTIEDATYEGSAGLRVNGGDLVVNGGTYHVSGNNSSSRHTFYVAKGKAIINGGTFTRSNNATDGYKRGATIAAEEGTEVVINGGSFAKGHSKTGNIIGGGKVTIYGGTFEFDPTEWLADGYTATQGADGWWTVSAQ